ncbi:MAG: hypothetical protein WCW31_01290 [Patescibacteria group bacterium]|jgi:hypothetical protein
MNRNHKLLVLFFALLVAALVGCGGAGTDPGDPVSPDQDAKADTDLPDSNPQPDADSATPDSDAGTDVQQPEADAPIAQDADAQAEADAPQSEDADAATEAEASTDDADAANPETSTNDADAAEAQAEACVPPLPGDPCTVCGAMSCDNKWRCSNLGFWDNPGKSLFNCGDAGAEADAPDSQDSGAEADAAQDAAEDSTDASDATDSADAAQEAEAGSCPGECTPGWKFACDTSCGTPGSMLGMKTCGSDCKWSACVAPSETCNGKDDDCNGIKDNGFPCAMALPYACHTACDPVGQNTGTATCTNTCQLSANCQAPVESCTNGRDDDCDGKSDCDDEDCWGNPACPHDFGTCDVIPNGTGITCEDPVKDTIPRFVDPQFGPEQYMININSGCANSLVDQWAVGVYVAKSESKLIHLSSGNTWNYVDIPFQTKVVGWGGQVSCQGANQVFMILIKKTTPETTVLAKWDGTQIVTLAEVAGFGATALWSSSPTHVVFAATKLTSPQDESRVYTWNSSSLSYVSMNLYLPDVFVPQNMWGSSPSDVYMVGSARDTTNHYTPTLTHWDGTSWSKIQVPSQITSLLSITGTSACDVMTVGVATGSGAMLQRNGNSWVSSTRSNLDSIVSVSKFSPNQFVLTGDKDLPMFLGTSNGNWSEIWKQVSGASGASVTWIASQSPKVVMMTENSFNEVKIHRSSCQ